MAATAILATLPVQAQSFYPNTYGSRFCELRRMGISKQQALKAAMHEAWSSNRQPSYVDYNGKRTSLDVLDAARYVANNCPELFQ